MKHILVILAIVAFAAATGLISNALRSQPLPLVQHWDESAAQLASDLPAGVGLIDLKTMNDLYNRSDVLVLDARDEDFYSLERIPGAKSLPLVRADELVPELVPGLPPSVLVITYCDGPTCPMAEELAARIVAAGHARTSVFAGGMAAWLSSRRPIASGEGN